MNQVNLGQLRAARADDIAQLLSLWGLVYNEVDPAAATPWKGHAREWFARSVDDNMSTRIPVIAVGGELVATAIGTIEIGVPNPHCPKGRTVRLANVITLPEHRGQSYRGCSCVTSSRGRGPFTLTASTSARHRRASESTNSSASR